MPPRRDWFCSCSLHLSPWSSTARHWYEEGKHENLHVAHRNPRILHGFCWSGLCLPTLRSRQNFDTASERSYPCGGANNTTHFPQLRGCLGASRTRTGDAQQSLRHRDKHSAHRTHRRADRLRNRASFLPPLHLSLLAVSLRSATAVSDCDDSAVLHCSRSRTPGESVVTGHLLCRRAPTVCTVPLCRFHAGTSHGLRGSRMDRWCHRTERILAGGISTSPRNHRNGHHPQCYHHLE